MGLVYLCKPFSSQSDDQAITEAAAANLRCYPKGGVAVAAIPMARWPIEALRGRFSIPGGRGRGLIAVSEGVYLVECLDFLDWLPLNPHY